MTIGRRHFSPPQPKKAPSQSAKMLPKPRHQCLPLLHAFIVHWLILLHVVCAHFRWAGPASVEAFTASSDHALASHDASRRGIGRRRGLASAGKTIDNVAITTQRIDPLAVPLINAFYKANRYKGRAKKSDVVFVAKQSSNDDGIVGAVRLVRKASDTFFIRNLFVAKECRRKGVGKLLMKAALDGNVGSASWSGAHDYCSNSKSGGIDKSTRKKLEDHHDHGYTYRYYCFLQRELSPIYHAAGLDVVDCQDVNLPDWIREEYLRIRAQQSKKDLILMGKGILQVLPTE